MKITIFKLLSCIFRKIPKTLSLHVRNMVFVLTLSPIFYLPWLSLPPLPHCPHYGHPISTIEPNTINDPSPPHPPSVTNNPPWPACVNCPALELSPLHIQVLSCASTGIESTSSGMPPRWSWPPRPTTRHSCSYDPFLHRPHDFPTGASKPPDSKGLQRPAYYGGLR